MVLRLMPFARLLASSMVGLLLIGIAFSAAEFLGVYLFERTSNNDR